MIANDLPPLLAVTCSPAFFRHHTLQVRSNPPTSFPGHRIARVVVLFTCRNPDIFFRSLTYGSLLRTAPAATSPPAVLQSFYPISLSVPFCPDLIAYSGFKAPHPTSSGKRTQGIVEVESV